MKRPRPAFLLLVLLPIGAGAGAPGSTSLDFLRLPESARLAAMASAGVGFPDESGSAQLNPAALGLLRSQEASFAYTRLYEGVGYGVMSYAHPAQKFGNFDLSLLHLDYGDIAGADASGAKTGNVSASDRQLRLSWAPQRETFIPGVSVKAVQEKLDNATATAFLADAGVLYRLRRMTFGASVRNLGTRAKYEGGSGKAPVVMALGATYRALADALSLSLDVERASGRPEPLALRTGAEIWLKDAVALRVGMRTNQDAGPGLSAGAGFKVGAARFDYALSPHGALGLVHHVGLSFKFGQGAVERYYEQGVHELRMGNAAEAVILFDKALAVDPKNRRVVEKALEAAKALEGFGEPEPAPQAAPSRRKGRP
ncbi:MAG: hypothetical protein A2V88_06855 [Elusimicrobia bacterium RBG_16_66_12]|nr:MAG: hypothetical protein A2V88_06855 [Elusimicrobia bacterium RBG_16_66_12]